MTRSAASFAVVPLLVAALLGACSAPAPEGTVQIQALPPSGAEFRPVALALNLRCGSLDCHGSKYRNLRLYGFGALRLDPAARPDDSGITDDELRASYEGIVGLEPELISAVVQSRGARMAELTFVRKARGTEAHKGGTMIKAGDVADQCLVSWLSSDRARFAGDGGDAQDPCVAAQKQ